MPTGYTAPVLDGSIVSLDQFAQNCARAFGAMLHMRDDSMSTPWTPVVPNTYHLNALTRARTDMKKYRAMPDDELLSMKEGELKSAIDSHAIRIAETKENLAKLAPLLKQAKAWKPPTRQHGNFKKFMVEQLTETIRFDANMSHIAKKPVSVKVGMKKWTAESRRQELVDACKRDIVYHKKEHAKEVAGCKARNKWVTDLQVSFSSSKSDPTQKSPVP